MQGCGGIRVHQTTKSSPVTKKDILLRDKKRKGVSKLNFTFSMTVRKLCFGQELELRKITLRDTIYFDKDSKVYLENNNVNAYFSRSKEGTVWLSWLERASPVDPSRTQKMFPVWLHSAS